MTSDDFENLFEAWGGSPRWIQIQVFEYRPRPISEWEANRGASLYWDKLYCEEIGIRYP